MSTEIDRVCDNSCRRDIRYTAFGSGVSTEIALNEFPWGEEQWSYTAFGSGVSTEIAGAGGRGRAGRVLHSLRLRGEH